MTMSSAAKPDNSNQENGQILSVDGFAQLERRIHILEDRAFIADIIDSTSRDSGIPAGIPGARHGGAIFDEERNQIISVTTDSSNCRDVFVTHLTDANHGTTEVKKNVIPFDCQIRVPMYDGKRFVYFAERGWCNNQVVCGRRFGRLDLDSYSFKELATLPDDPFKMFAPCFHGCYHNGSVYMSDNESQLCRYIIERNEWRRCGIPLPVSGGDGNKYGYLLSDPSDENHLYLLGSCTKPGLYRIDFESFTCTMLSPTSGALSSFDAILVRPRPESNIFAVVAVVGGSAWHAYSSKSNKWKALTDWKGPGCTWCRGFLAYAQTTKTFYYHIHGQPTWEIVQL